MLIKPAYGVYAMLALAAILVSQHAMADTEVVIPLGASHQETGVFYSPSVVDIRAGDTVTWKNEDASVHTVSTGTPGLGVDGRMDSGIIKPGESFSHAFGKEGVYGYYCIIHPWMTGTVNVGTDMPPKSPVGLSIYTDKPYYMPGEHVTVSGQASAFVPDEIVTVWVTDLSGNGVASNHVSTETSDRFSTTIMPTSLWIPGNEYVINAQYGARGTIASTDIMYGSGPPSIPAWLKGTASQWAMGQVSDKTFASAIQYLIREGIVKAPQVYFVVDSNYHMPAWLKNTAEWWSQGQVPDNDFAQTVQYLMSSGIIHVSP